MITAELTPELPPELTPYRAPLWLPGGHAQTVYPLLIRPMPYPYQRERWETPDNDFIDLDWSEATASSPGATAGKITTPLVVLFHGLEGSSNSHYALSLMYALKAIGWGGVVIHFRGCSGELNRQPRAYHSGDSDEIDWILRRLKTCFPERELFAVGVSLGGNALLKWLGERGNSAENFVRAAAAVSAPVDLTLCGHHLGRGFNRVYTRYFLRTLKPSSAARLKRFPGLFDERRLREASSLYEFDNVVTAPLHHFASADDYWLRASSKPWLNAIRLPTLMLNAQNDPFMPHRALPGSTQVSSSLTLDFPKEGGHVGFVSGRLPGQLDWLPQRLLYFFQQGR